MRVLLGNEKPRCHECGSDMEKVLCGGERYDHATGKWVASRQESWMCLTAAARFDRAAREAMEKVRAEFAHHRQPIRYVREAAVPQETLALGETA